MELAFDERNLLVPGVYDVPLETVKQKFGSFQKSDRRPTLFAKLVEYLEAVQRAGIGASVIVDGSFVMGCVDEPGDIDLILILPADWDLDADLQPYQYNVVSKRMIKAMFPFDVIVAKAGSAEEAMWLEFFGQVNIKWSRLFAWPDDLRKGILRVTP